MNKKGYTIKKIFGRLGMLMAIVLSVFATLLCFSIMWMFKTWSNLTIDELIFHITAPLEGTNDALLNEYMNTCVTPAVLILLLIIILFVSFRKWEKLYYLIMAAGIIVPIFAASGFVSYAWNSLEVGNYVKDQGTYSTFIDDNYMDPRDVELTFPEQKRNLIYIFLESMETTFADKKNGGAFKENVIPQLTKLAQENEDFSGDSVELNGGYAMPGSTWTIAAMFSQTSGIPLSISIEDNSMDTQDSFFANAVTLGDILRQEGYSQSLLIGSDAVFGGRELYFSEHGDYNILDYKHAANSEWIPEDYRVWWGYEDQKLFKFAKQKLLELADEGAPFNLTMLTVDTHAEDGFPCELCRNIYGEDQYANVMECSSRQVESFISWIQNQSFYDNTTIVLVGDHPTMDSDFCEDIDNEYVRKVYTNYINSVPESVTKESRNYTTFDIFPTTLASMGVSIEGDRLGLGTSLFSEKPTLSERFGINEEKRELSKRSKLMESLADLDENKKELLLREGKVPTASVIAEDYDYLIGSMPVKVCDIINAQEGIESVILAVYTEEDQSDLQWIPMELQEDGSYYINVNIPNFNYKLGEYYIEAYMTDVHGDQYILGDTVGFVK